MTDYEALMRGGRRGGQLARDLADAVEALIQDRDGWRDAASTYKASRDASDARAAAARKEALREAADTIEKLDGQFNWDEIHRVAPWLRALAEGVSDGQQ